MILRNWFFFLLLILLGACVEPFDVVLTPALDRMVVDGLISDQPGPYEVKLYMSIPVANQFEEVNWVSGATVTLFDDQENQEILQELSPGHYYTAAGGMQGVVGRAYHIRIVRNENEVYESTPETMLPAGEFNALYYSFEENENPVLFDQITTTNGFRVFMDGRKAPGQPRLRWRWSGTFSIYTHPELRTKVIPKLNRVPDPWPCSGFIAPRNVLTFDTPCTCCLCYVTDHSRVPMLSDAKFFQQDMIDRLEITFIEANRRHFYEKYYLQVEQMSMTEAAYDFWTKVKAQQSSGSDLFQTPPAATTGNLNRTSTNGVAVIGIFSASSILKKVLEISRTDIPYPHPLEDIDIVPRPCTAVYVNSESQYRTTTVKPSFW